VDLFDPKVYREHFLPLLLSLVKDKVPNIRLNVASALKKIITLNTGHFTVQRHII